jgi:hypothetical protein
MEAFTHENSNPYQAVILETGVLISTDQILTSAGKI